MQSLTTQFQFEPFDTKRQTPAPAADEDDEEFVDFEDVEALDLLEEPPVPLEELLLLLEELPIV